MGMLKYHQTKVVFLVQIKAIHVRVWGDGPSYIQTWKVDVIQAKYNKKYMYSPFQRLRLQNKFCI